MEKIQHKGPDVAVLHSSEVTDQDTGGLERAGMRSKARQGEGERLNSLVGTTCPLRGDSRRSLQATISELYLNSLSEKEKKAYNIAKGHLGMSFQLEKSLGYLKWYSGRNIDAKQ